MFSAPKKGTLRPGQKRVTQERAERHALAKAATLCLDGADKLVPCTLRDLSTSGARLSGPNLGGIPEYCLLISRSENLVARTRVAWRKDFEVGVQFIRKADLSREDTMRREQAAAYAKELAAIAEQQRLAREQHERFEAEQRAYLDQAAALRKQQLIYFGLDPDQPYTEQMLKSGYRKLAMKLHPDRGGCMEQFQNLNLIYQNLTSHLQSTTPEQAIAV